MALTFEPEGVVYDPDEGLVRFFATEGLALVRCGVSIAALAELEDDALGGRDAIMTAYLRHRELIQDITERKYRACRFEAGGNVVVRHEEVTTTENALANRPMTIQPVRLQLSRRKGFDLQTLSLATNGLLAVNCARPSKFGNRFRVGAPARLEISDF